MIFYTMGVKKDTCHDYDYIKICKIDEKTGFPPLFKTAKEAQDYIDSFNFEYDNMVVVPIKTADHEE